MARIRSIKPEFFDDPDLAACSFPARLLFVGLWVHADRSGRIEYDPRRIKARVFPYDDVNVSVLATELERAAMVRLYVAAGRDYLWVVNFEKHQNPHHKEPESRIPAYSDDARKSLGNDGVGRAGSCSLSLGTGSLSLEGASRSHASAKPDPGARGAVERRVLLQFPTRGTMPCWDFDEAQAAAWSELYAGLDVLAEARRALAWVGAHPDRRKSARGMPAFLVNWFNRAIDRGQASGPASTVSPRIQRAAAAAAAFVEEGA